MTPSADGPEDERADEPPNSDDHAVIDEAFNAIVSGIRHGERPPEVPIWPVAEDDGPATSEPLAASQLGSKWSGWEDVAPPAPAEELDDADDDGEFVPPPPPPIPKGDPVLRWAWVGAVGAPFTAVVLALIGWDFGGLVGLGLVTAFFVGFVTLISRLRSGPKDSDSPDDGAVV